LKGKYERFIQDLPQTIKKWFDAAGGFLKSTLKARRSAARAAILPAVSLA